MIRLCFQPFPELTTARLILRALKQTDAKEIFTLRSSPEVNKYLNRVPARTINDAREFIRKIKKAVRENQGIFWAVCFRDQPSLVGTICFWNILAEDHKADIGYELLPEHQGKGIMVEAVPAVIRYGFEEMQLNCIQAELESANHRSVQLLEKAGFHQEDTGNKPIDPDIVIYSLSRHIRP